MIPRSAILVQLSSREHFVRQCRGLKFSLSAVTRGEEDQSDEDVEIKQRRNKHSLKRKTTRGSQTV